MWHISHLIALGKSYHILQSVCNGIPCTYFGVIVSSLCNEIINFTYMLWNFAHSILHQTAVTIRFLPPVDLITFIIFVSQLLLPVSLLCWTIVTCTIRYKIIVMNTIGAAIDLRRSKLQDPFPDTCFEHSNVLFQLFTFVTEMQLEKLV